MEIDAAYNNEKIPLNIFIPKNVSPPSKRSFVPAQMHHSKGSKNLDGKIFWISYEVRLRIYYPIYKGTWERAYPEFSNYVQNPSKNYSNQMVMMVKDFSAQLIC
ncbi:hypothetical protein Ct9H90mP29_15840 [bacterium]|nr:MAG: hypothetical protein Ct9H90mP29_15840 [bacterium]